MARPNDSQWDTLCLEAEQTIRRLRRDGPAALRRGARKLHDGYPRDSMPGPGGKGGISRPVEAAVIAMDSSDPTRSTVLTMISDLQQAIRALRHADGARAKVLGDGEAPLAKVIPLRPERGKGDCEACGTYMDGSADTKRLKDGLCPTHWMRWLRRGRPDKAEFRASVQAGLTERQAV